MSRNTWRNIFIGIIILTIPCYLFGIFVFYYNGGSTQDTPTPSAIPSRTPINVTELALTDPSLIVTDIILTNTPGTTATPFIIPTSNVIFTSVPFFNNNTCSDPFPD